MPYSANPPGLMSRLSKRTRAPLLASSRAPNNPAGPAPITATKYCCVAVTTPPKIAPNQTCKLADYSQKEIQRQDGQLSLYVTLVFVFARNENLDSRKPISMLRLQIHCNLSFPILRLSCNHSRLGKSSRTITNEEVV